MKRHHGFTLIEILICVTVIGVVGAVAIPAMIRMRRHAHTTEAADSLALIYRASVAYYTHDRPELIAAHAHRQFPDSAPLTPTTVPANRVVDDVAGTWDQPTWRALNFQAPQPHAYAYEYESEGNGVNAVFTARAIGDLDGDGTRATFERSGQATVNYEVQGSSAVWMLNENE